ncbi:hypothetical protein GV64_03895 [Endozoicomonas elysicola]|uniref:Uncharacterized protein n=2 Tax=Endozoicomonas elysicola TaxID=305900 RepID=A0A081K775_9GAMM|nr:hypothetical protein GV64_03895 [Endozoicomonas elysicola]
MPLHDLNVSGQEPASQCVKAIEASGYIEAAEEFHSDQASSEKFRTDLSRRKLEKRDVETSCDLISIDDWPAFFSKYPDDPEEAFGDLCRGKVGAEIKCIWTMFDNGNYDGVIEKGLGLYEGINCSFVSTQLVKYVRSLILLSEILALQDGFDISSPGECFSSISSVTTKSEYIDFFLALGDAARKGDEFIFQSPDLERMCLYRAADAGSELAKRALIKDMLFGRREDREELTQSLFYPSEALAILRTMPVVDVCFKQDASYDELLDQLKVLTESKSSADRCSFIDSLSKDLRPEVVMLIPMVLLEPDFGDVNPCRALSALKELPVYSNIRAINNYWSCRAQIESQNGLSPENVQKLKGLIRDNLSAASGFILDEYCRGYRSLPMVQVYQGQLDDVPVARSLAYQMFKTSHLLDHNDDFRSDRNVQATIDVARVVALNFGAPDLVLDELYSSCKDIFSPKLWMKLKDSKLKICPDEVFKWKDEFEYYEDSKCIVFRDAINVWMGNLSNAGFVKAALEKDPVHASFWMLCLNHQLQDMTTIELLTYFWDGTRKDPNSIAGLVFTSGFPVVLEQLYRYAVLLNFFDDSDLFDPERLMSFGLDKETKSKCLLQLAENNELCSRLDRASLCYRLAQEIMPREGREYHNHGDYRVMKQQFSDMYRKFYCLKLLPQHPLGNYFGFYNFMEIMKGLKADESLDFHVEFVEHVLDFVAEACHHSFSPPDLIVELFDGCSELITWVRTFVLGESVRIHKGFESWLKKIPKEHEFDRYCLKLNDQKEYLQEMIGDFYRAKSVRDFSGYQQKEYLDQLLSPFHCITEHRALHQLRQSTCEDEFIMMLRNVYQDKYLDVIPVMDLVFGKLSPLLADHRELMVQIVSRFEDKVERATNHEFELTVQLVNTMHTFLKNSQPYNCRVALIYYKTLTKFSVEVSDVLKRVISKDYGECANFYKVSEEYNSADQMSYFIDGFSRDVRLSLCFGLWVRVVKKYSGNVLSGDKYNPTPQSIADVRKQCLSSFIIYSLEKNKEIVSAIFQFMEGDRLSPVDQSSLLWFGYEAGVLTRQDHGKLLQKLSHESLDYFFHSLLFASDPDAVDFLRLQTPDTLGLPTPKCEALGMKAFELGRIQDAKWLAENRMLSHIEAMLAWNNGVSSKVDAQLLEGLLDDARNGKNQAQCRSIDWLLEQRKLSNNVDELFEAQCCFYLHIPSIWTDSQRLLYQGLALCAGLGGYVDENLGSEKVKAALTTEDPIIPFLLYCHQSSGRVKSVFSTVDLLIGFAKKMPVPCNKVMAEILLIVGMDECLNGIAELERLLQVGTTLNQGLGSVVDSLSSWLSDWNKCCQLQKMKPLDKWVCRLEEEANDGWPISNLSLIKDNIEIMNSMLVTSGLFQKSLIKAIKTLYLQSSAEHKEFAEFLLKRVTREYHSQLLSQLGEFLNLSNPHFDTIDRYNLYLSLPAEHQSANIALLADYIVKVDLHENKAPVFVKQDLDKAGWLSLIRGIAKDKASLVDHELDQMTLQKREHIRKEKKNRILSVISHEYEYESLVAAHLHILKAQNVGVEHTLIRTFIMRLMPRVVKVLKGEAGVMSNEEILAAAAIRLREF